MRPIAVLLALAAGFAGRAVAQVPGPRLVLIDSVGLRARRLSESSGVAESRRRPGVFWTLNDSGDGPWLYATDSSGADLGRVLVRNARNIDWEDLAMGPCPVSTGNCLFIADIGDNGNDRAMVFVYAVPEPEPPREASDTSGRVDYEAIIDLHYRDRRHNAEALAVDGTTLLLVTKDRSGPATLYRARIAPTGSQLLERIGDLAMETGIVRGRLATGAAVIGRVLAVRTYVSIHLFAIDRGFAALTSPNGLPIPAIEMQGEGICFDHLGRVVLTSEGGMGRHATITRIRLEGIAP